jgi:hypothetical protein
MRTSALTRRRLLLSVVLTVGLAGCSGAPNGGSDGTTSTEGPDSTADSDAASTDSTGATDSTGESTVTSKAKTSDATATDTPGTDGRSPADDETDTTSADDELDLREANVVEVAVSRSGGSYRFDVTLYHDDDGEDGYANWWQVETLDGRQLGRRELLHAHSTAPFTRSETVSIPDGTTYVVVRGHDQTHGYGGQAMVVNVDTGETETVRQGPEPRDLSAFEPGV